MVRNVNIRGKSKLCDKWERDPYRILEIPIYDLPVCKVQRENGKGPVKTLHRNMLLPFMYIPTSQDISHTTNSGTKQKQPKVSVKPSQKSVSESDGNSSSDSDEPSCVIPIRRNSGCRRKTPPKCSNLGENGNYHYSRYSDVTTKGDNISNLSPTADTE